MRLSPTGIGGRAMQRRLLLADMLIANAAIAGCAANSQEAVAPPPPPPPIVVPVELTVWQRSTTVVPGSQDALELTVDDITRGQVMASLSRRGEIVRAPVSLTKGSSAEFSLDGHAYELQITELKNSLLGDDSATFVIKAAGAAPGEAEADEPLSEMEKIELLIQSLGRLENAVFIRNGREHTVEEAVEHMRMKWEAAGERITTAREFIEGAASRSSTSGRPYEIRFADGRTVPSREFLYERLERIEAKLQEQN